MATILIAEDSFAISQAVSALLESEFHTVLTAGDGVKALDIYWRIHPDLLILDVMLPMKNGFDVCRQIRASDRTTPILFLSAKSSETDKVLGLGLGADDYVVKPFGTHELSARVAALLRRCRRVETIVNQYGNERFHLGTSAVIGSEMVLVTAEGARIPLTKREYMLLWLLKSRYPEIVTKEEITENVWGITDMMHTRNLEQHLCNLRRKIKGNGFSIVTVPRSGVKIELAKNDLEQKPKQKGKRK